ncbi:hypothetical protein [Dysosmobacter sp.]|uniref:hypothetical protein n=1 Tax=Dysosmobacter sp. TaxID=2591382 RepID=UPI003A8CF09C
MGSLGKLFRRDMDPRCAYCEKGQQINEREVACVKRGVVPVESHCRSFRYDPLKRVPPRPAALDTENLNEEDFSL